MENKAAGNSVIKAAEEDYPIGWPELGKLLLWGSLLGFGARGAVGLGRMAGRRLRSAREDKTEDELKEEAGQTMTTSDPATSNPYQPKLASEKQAKGLAPLPATLLGMLAGAGGLYGGWKLSDTLFDRERIKVLDEEIEEARREYEETLKSKAKLRLRTPKVAAFIDTLAESYERGELIKEADISVLDALPYALYSILAAAAANEGYKAFQAARKADPTVAKLQALKHRPPAKRVWPIRAELEKPLDEEERKPVPSMVM